MTRTSVNADGSRERLSLDPVAVAASAMVETRVEQPARKIPRRRRRRDGQLAEDQVADLADWAPRPDAARAASTEAVSTARAPREWVSEPVDQERGQTELVVHQSLDLVSQAADGIVATAAKATGHIQEQLARLRDEVAHVVEQRQAVSDDVDAARRLLHQIDDQAEEATRALTKVTEVAHQAQLRERTAAASLTAADSMAGRAHEAQQRHLEAELGAADAAAERRAAETLLTRMNARLLAAQTAAAEAVEQLARARGDHLVREDESATKLDDLRREVEAARDVFTVASDLRLELERDAADLASQLTSLRRSFEAHRDRADKALSRTVAEASDAEAAHAARRSAEQVAEAQAVARAEAESSLRRSAHQVVRANEAVLELAEQAMQAEQARRSTADAAAQLLRTFETQLEEAGSLTRNAVAARVSAEEVTRRGEQALALVTDRLSASLQRNEALAADLATATAAATAATRGASDAQAREQEASASAQDAHVQARESHVKAARLLDESAAMHEELHQEAANLRAELVRNQAQVSACTEQLSVQRDEFHRAVSELLHESRGYVQSQGRVGRARPAVLRTVRALVAGSRRRPTAGEAEPVLSRTSSAITAVPDLAPRGDDIRALTPRGHPLGVQYWSAGLVALVVILSTWGGVGWLPSVVLVGVGLLLVRWRFLSRRTTVELTGSVLRIRRHGARHVFDLADPLLRVDVTEAPGPGVPVAVFHRRGLSPVVLRQRDVDSAELIQEYRRWRHEAS